MKVVDIQLTINGILLDDADSIDDWVESLKINAGYVYLKVLYEEEC